MGCCQQQMLKNAVIFLCFVNPFFVRSSCDSLIWSLWKKSSRMTWIFAWHPLLLMSQRADDTSILWKIDECTFLRERGMKHFFHHFSDWISVIQKFSWVRSNHLVDKTFECTAGFFMQIFVVIVLKLFFVFSAALKFWGKWGGFMLEKLGPVTIKVSLWRRFQGVPEWWKGTSLLHLIQLLTAWWQSKLMNSTIGPGITL